MALNETRLRMMAVPLPGARVLRLALLLDDDDSPVDLTIAAGFDSDAAMRVLGSGVTVPASALPALRDALVSLQPPSSATEGPEAA